jgi:hypothetical protein
MEARSNYYLAKARSQVLNFLDSAKSLEIGERRTLVIRDYHANESNNHGPPEGIQYVQGKPESPSD